jgi:hypothetical protein
LVARDAAPADRAAAAAAAAGRAALRALTEAKAAGRDHDTADMVALRLALAGSRVALAPPTANVRDAIFRSAAGAAAAAVSGGGGVAALGGLSPADFVAGLAADLGLPAPAAANMAAAAVAARSRALLVDALAAQREAASPDAPRVLGLLAALASLLEALPFPPGAPQPPMVAAALAGRVRRDELVSLGRAAAALEPELAAAVAELLGLAEADVR